ncbi:MAG TPA: phage tail sheath C-terminal domain-containing protein [Syntrophobacteria bacterium]|nr:phage tail sheath C-terminal domain-containing protein [Syntrophobacteria bacterium]
MAQYLAPGVYIEEMPGPKPFQAVGTATGAFIGIAERGPIGEAKLITNWTQFVDTFGGFIPSGYLAYAVNQFFTEGGTSCYVVRTCHYNYATTPAAHLASKGSITLQDTASAPANTLTVEAQTPGSWSDHVWLEIADAKKDPANKFRIAVWFKGVAVEAHEELAKGDVVGKVNAASKYISVNHAGTSLLPPGRSVMPVNDRAATPKPTLGITALEASVTVSIVAQASDKFGIIVYQAGAVLEKFLNLSLADMEQKVNGVSRFIKVQDLKSTTASPGNLPASSSVSLNDRAGTPLPTLSVTALGTGLSIDTADGTAADSFKITVKRAAATLETYDNLTIANVESTINGISPSIFVSNLNSATAAPGNRPANATGTALTAPSTTLKFFVLAGGDDGLGDGFTFNDSAATPAAALQVNAFRDGVKVKIADATSGTAKFKLTVVVGGSDVETYDELIMDTVEDEINGQSQFIEVVAKGANRPANTGAATDIPTGLADMDFIGDAATKNGLYAFDTVDDINILAIPDRPGDREVIIAAYTYCQNRKDCFFVADSPFGLDPQQVLAFKEGTGSFAGNAFNSSYAALYYPWILTSDPLTGGSRLVPPAGAVVGTYSSTDVVRGVHKAPAGTIDGYLNSAVGIARLVTKGEQELLNPENINVIRSFPGAGIVVWGARTLSADAEWRYVNVRRLLLYIEETIDKNTQWVVFEPNDQSLWARVKRDVSAFLTDVWRSGALFGTTAEEAFFVKIDTENNPPEVRDAGRLVIDIGVAPVKPAEFVVFRITQQTPKK